MFKSNIDLTKYIRENFLDITSSRINDDHWDLMCSKCNIVRGFQVTRRGYTSSSTNYYGPIDQAGARSVFLKCPVCEMYKILIVFKISGGKSERWFQVAEMPSSGMEGVEDLPETPKSLRIAYRQAVNAMGANAYIAAAVMYRRALQIITRDIGKAKPGMLGAELSELVGKKINGVMFTQDFSSIGYIVKEAGNQGAHPDKDEELLDFTSQDAKDLHSIFTTMVAELFVAPRAAEEAKKRFLKNRKIA